MKTLLQVAIGVAGVYALLALMNLIYQIMMPFSTAIMVLLLGVLPITAFVVAVCKK